MLQRTELETATEKQYNLSSVKIYFFNFKGKRRTQIIGKEIYYLTF